MLEISTCQNMGQYYIHDAFCWLRHIYFVESFQGHSNRAGTWTRSSVGLRKWLSPNLPGLHQSLLTASLASREFIKSFPFLRAMHTSSVQPSRRMLGPRTGTTRNTFCWTKQHCKFKSRRRCSAARKVGGGLCFCSMYAWACGVNS